MGDLLRPPSTEVRALHSVDLAHANDLHAAMLEQAAPRVRWALYMLILILVSFTVWASVTRVEEVTRGNGKVISDSGDQVIQSLEGGILAKLNVKEGDKVEAGQVLLEIDATRANAVYKEGYNKMVALQAAAARLRAEAYSRPLNFPPGLRQYPEVVSNETLAYNSRRQALDQSVAELRHSLQLAEQEVQMSEQLMARGLISDIELLRMKRQANDFRLQIAERESKYRAEANSELGRVESDLAQSRENVVARADTAQHTVIKAPVRGVVKDVRISTIGGVIQPAATIMEIVPLDDRLLVEAKIKPQDVAFVHAGLPATVKVTAYDFGIYGGLDGVVELVSPDTLREESRVAVAATGEESYYRVLVRTRESSIRVGGKAMPIIPGMTTTVDIRSGEKTILDYLLKPIYKAQEAFRER
jgi:adhesin transport system membrane fusion protein